MADRCVPQARPIAWYPGPGKRVSTATVRSCDSETEHDHFLAKLPKLDYARDDGGNLGVPTISGFSCRGCAELGNVDLVRGLPSDFVELVFDAG